jgi:tetratricopeptide (TPR) repeat protein
MSILYNRLKNAEKDKKQDAPLSVGEEFPIDGEIKRQKEERRRRTKWGISGGMVVFLLILSLVVFVMTIKKIKPAANKIRKPPKYLVKEPPPAAEKAGTNSPATVLGKTASNAEQTEPPVEPEPAAEPVVLPGELFEQGLQLYKDNQYPEAAAIYAQGLQQDPQQAVGYNNLGVVYYKQGKLQKSLAQLKLAVELNPRYAEAHYNLAVVLERFKQDKQALTHYLKFLKFAAPQQQALQEKVQAHVRYYY